MTPEIKAAAERIISPERYPESEDYDSDAHEVARAYRELFDETPVAGDKDWLLEHGFAEDDFGDFCCGKVFITADCLFVADADDEIENTQVSVLICRNPTCGEVLRLLSVVGKESE